MNSPPPTLVMPCCQSAELYLPGFCSRVDYYDDDDYVGQRRRVEIVTTQELLERSLCCFTRRLVWPKHCCVAAKYYDFIAISLMKRPVCQAASLKHHDYMFAIQVTLLSILQEVTEVNNLPLEFQDVNQIFFFFLKIYHIIRFVSFFSTGRYLGWIRLQSTNYQQAYCDHATASLLGYYTYYYCYSASQRRDIFP